MRVSYYILAVVVVIVIVIMWQSYNNKSTRDDYMYGMWVGDKGFCQEAECDFMKLFIGDPVRDGILGCKRPCHLIIGGVNAQLMDMRYYPRVVGGCDRYTVNTQLEFDQNEIWESKCKFEFDRNKGCLRVYAGDELYGVFYKDHEITSLFDKEN